MNRLTNSSMTRRGTQRLLIALFASLLIAPSVWAQSGNVEIRSANSELRDGVHRASARIQFQLSERIDNALANGIELAIRFDFEIYRQRRFWPDANVATLQVVNVLRFNKVSERYTLVNENTGRRTSYATIFAALNAMGRIDGLPLVDAALLRDGASHSVRLRADVSMADYPVSLRYLLFWRDDWHVNSDWYSWSLDP
ncbi:MAG: DUF4390 domain-containing protein [Pseudomonadota bacterium]